MSNTVSIPVAGLGFGTKGEVRFERSTPRTDRLKRVVDAGDFSGAMKLGPQIVRTGDGGYAQQIEQRSWYMPDGRISMWSEPAYTEGRRHLRPQEAVERENVIWDAVLGGVGGTESNGKDWFEVSVDDDVVKRESTMLGNQLPVPATVSYAAFVTGGISLATNSLSRMAVAVKPSKRKKPRRPVERFAMYWFLKLAYKYRMTDEDLARGIMTPPKRVGYNPKMEAAIVAQLRKWLTGEANA